MTFFLKSGDGFVLFWTEFQDKEVFVTWCSGGGHVLAESTVDLSCVFVFISGVMAVMLCPYRRSTFHPRK